MCRWQTRTTATSTGSDIQVRAESTNGVLEKAEHALPSRLVGYVKDSKLPIAYYLWLRALSALYQSPPKNYCLRCGVTLVFDKITQGLLEEL